MQTGATGPDLLKDETELQSSGICVLMQKGTECFFRIRQISLNSVI